MADKFTFTDEGLDFHLKISFVELQNEILKSTKFIHIAQSGPFKNLKAARDYDIQYNRLGVLKLIEKLRSGIITREKFNDKVEIKKESISN